MPVLELSVIDNYNDLINYMSENYDEVDGVDFYNEIFPNNQTSGVYDDNDYVPNGIYMYSINDVEKKRKMSRRIMLNDTWSHDYNEYVYDNEFALCSGLSFRGRANRLENAQRLHALIFDLDKVTINELLNLIKRMGQPPAFRTLPQATYLVVSGTGLHIYYLLDEPVDLYPNIKIQMKALKYDLTFRAWDFKGTTLEKVVQFQSISQGYRMVGSLNNKYDLRIRAFRVGSKVSLDTLNSYTTDESNKVDLKKPFRPSVYTKEEAKSKFPDWYEKVIVRKDKSPSKWSIKPDLYYWWLRQIDKVKGGHRYYFLMCMSIYAVKCDIPKKELKKDMQVIFDEISDIEHSNKLTEDDMISALEAYDRSYYNFTIDDIVKLTDISITKNKRNFQKQKLHLEEARAIRDVRMKRQNKNWYDNGGRPINSGTKEELVTIALKDFPDTSISNLSIEFNISRTTIYKYLKKRVIK